MVANDLMDLLQELRGLLQIELREVTSGTRVLTKHDFLGPTERKKMRFEAIEKGLSNTLIDKHNIAEEASRRHLANEDEVDYSQFYRQVELKLLDDRRSNIKANVFKDVDGNGNGLRKYHLAISRVAY